MKRIHRGDHIGIAGETNPKRRVKKIQSETGTVCDLGKDKTPTRILADNNKEPADPTRRTPKMRSSCILFPLLQLFFRFSHFLSPSGCRLHIYV